MWQPIFMHDVLLSSIWKRYATTKPYGKDISLTLSSSTQEIRLSTKEYIECSIH